MKILAILAVLLISGCSTVVPVTQKWPEPPGLQALKTCETLKKLDKEPQLSDVAKTVTSNYDEYWMCKIKLDAWIEWYQKQELIHKGLK